MCFAPLRRREQETRIALNYGHLGLLKALLLYVLLAHWFACILVLPTTFYAAKEDTWLGNYNFCTADGCASTTAIYVATLSHTLQLICSMSGGEIDHFALNTQEQAIYMLMSVIGALLWGYVLATWVSVLSHSDPNGTWFRQTMDGLNSFMSQYGLAPEMRVRLREYFQRARPCAPAVAHYLVHAALLLMHGPSRRIQLDSSIICECAEAKHVHQGQMRRELLRLMSPMLHGEVALAISGKWLRKLHFLRGVEKEMMILVATNLRPAVFAPSEVRSALTCRPAQPGAPR